MRVDWRLLLGPALVLTAATTIAAAEFAFSGYANAGTLLLAAIAIGAALFSLRQQNARARAREHERRIENDALRSALDRVEYGVVLLDPGLQARFINRAFRQFWKLPEEVAESKPSFAALMYHGRNVNAFAEQRGGIDNYIASRVARVREGDTAPLDIKHNNGEVIRFQCTPLPDGGRMLSYVPVTDLFRHADALRKLATVDGLTGVNNRRHFLEMAEAEWSRFQRYQRPLSIVMFDIDHFKSVNDRFGHDAGDAVLVEFAKVCRGMTRVSDIVGRLGGEEFAMLLPETDLSAAWAVAERLRQSVEEHAIDVGGQMLSITVSAGVAPATVSMSGIPRLMKSADEALYTAKHGGRNQVVAAAADAAEGIKVAAE